MTHEYSTPEDDRAAFREAKFAARDKEIEMSHAAMRQGQAAQREIDGLHKALQQEIAQREACEGKLADAYNRTEELERIIDDLLGLAYQMPGVHPESWESELITKAQNAIGTEPQ